MRIYGNRLLKTLPGKDTRPTTARVREALFYIWQDTIANCHWLDLCAGNGSMGAEALCRGASWVVGIEKNGRACRVLRDNWEKVNPSTQQFQVLRGNVLTRLGKFQGQQFDHIYFDPPYQSSLYDPVLKAIATLDLLKSTGEIAVEHNLKLWTPQSYGHLNISRQKNYGNTTLTFYGQEP